MIASRRCSADVLGSELKRIGGAAVIFGEAGTQEVAVIENGQS
jgi:hypothetical protein